MNSKELMNKAADNIRILVASMVEKANQVTRRCYGRCRFYKCALQRVLEYDPRNMKFFGRDRFFLDPGHMAPMLYAQLAIIGKYSMEELAILRQWIHP